MSIHKFHNSFLLVAVLLIAGFFVISWSLDGYKRRQARVRSEEVSRLYFQLATAGQLDGPAGGQVVITPSHHSEFFMIWFCNTNDSTRKALRYKVHQRDGKWVFDDATCP